MYFRTNGLRKTLLDKCLKSPVSEDPSTGNVVNGLKQCVQSWMTAPLPYLLIPVEDTRVEKGSPTNMKNQDCLLTHWLLITCTLFLIETIYSNIFRFNYVRNEKYCLNIFSHFLNLDSILNILKKTMTLIADVFLNSRTPKDVVR